METIIVAVLSLLGTVIGSFLAYNKTVSLVQYRLEQLENKVSVHNNLIDRMYGVEKDIAVMKEDIQELKDSLN